MKRRFNREQKEALYWLAKGKCQQCGVALSNDWHADHLHPFAYGGQTDVINGQALCPNCNFRKGDKLMLMFPFDLRLWQQEFLDRYNAAELQNFLLVATPGAGKTIASLKAAHELLKFGIVQRIIIVCPSDNLRTQWLDEATKVNIHLDKIQLGWSGQIAQTTDYIGMVTTYAQVVNKKEHLRVYTGRFRTLVILDEVHHCGDGEEEHLAWGEAIKHAFSPAARRLLLSGTPFRSDNNPIPFVEYETAPFDPDARVSIAHYSYGYGDALKDENVVRHIVFPTYDGRYIWENFGQKKEATFKDRLDRYDSRHRLRTALHPNGDWIKEVIKAADERLNIIRQDEGYKCAGGLIVAQDQEHAKEYARVLKEVTGEGCTLAISDSEDASQAISKYRCSSQKWIVAVKMVSEGVDIKRLRVGIYATNTKTPTFFRQVIGRVIRWDNDRRWEQLDDQTAWFYLPEDPKLVQLAEQIKVEITDTIRIQELKDKENVEQRGDGMQLLPESMQPMFDLYEFRHSEGEESDHIFNGEKFPPEELESAERHLAFSCFELVPSAAKAFAWRRLKKELQSSPQSFDKLPSAVSPQSRRDRKEQLQSLCHKKVARLARVCQQNGIRISDKNPYQAINLAWGRKWKYSGESTNSELEDKLTWLEGLILRALQGDSSIIGDLRR